jgi:hypothetical protein
VVGGGSVEGCVVVGGEVVAGGEGFVGVGVFAGGGCFGVRHLPAAALRLLQGFLSLAGCARFFALAGP